MNSRKRSVAGSRILKTWASSRLTTHRRSAGGGAERTKKAKTTEIHRTWSLGDEAIVRLIAKTLHGEACNRSSRMTNRWPGKCGENQGNGWRLGEMLE
jgi:hypothetical protein